MNTLFMIWQGWNRYSRRQKLQILICVIGLSLGMACFAMSMLWLKEVESYETFVPDADRIFIPGKKSVGFVSGMATYSGDAYLAKYLISKIPEIESATHIYTSAYYNHKYEIKCQGAATEARVVMADTTFTSMYGINPIHGNWPSPTPDRIAITRSLSKKLYGTDNSVGKKAEVGIAGNTASEYTIGAVLPDWPKNSQFGCDILMMHQSEPTDFIKWGRNHITMLKLYDAGDAPEVEKKIRELFNDPQIAWNTEYNTDLLPLTKLKSLYPKNNDSVRFSYIKVFILIGILVILSALSNYILTLINTLHIRRHSMSMHRLLGATKGRLIALSALDTLMVMLTSAIVGILLMMTVTPTFREYAGISMDISDVVRDTAIYLVAVIAIGLTVSSATTSAVLSQGHKSILQGHASHHNSSMLEKTSNVIQLAFCTCMLICVSTMILQLRYLSNRHTTGFDYHNIASFFYISPEIKQKVMESPLVTEHIEGYPSIYPIYLIDRSDIGLEKHENTKAVNADILPISESMYNFWGMTALNGRLPRPDTNEAMVSESTVEALNMTSPIGQRIYVEDNDNPLTIVGVMSDVYTVPPTIRPNPAVYTYEEPRARETDPYMVEASTFAVRVIPGAMDDFMSYIKPLIKAENEMYEAEYAKGKERDWLDTTSEPVDVASEYEKMLTSERLLARLMLVIALCGIVVSIFNVYAGLSLSLQERKKEIVLRKINGAKPRRITAMYLRGYMITLAIATLLALPISVISMIRWLENFRKHIPFPWYTALGAFALLAAIIVATTSRRIYKATKANEAEALKEL